MSPKPSARPSTGESSSGDRAEPRHSFETLLEQLLAELEANPDPRDGARAALDQIAEYFSAEQIALKLSDGLRTDLGAPEESTSAALEVAVSVGGCAPIGTVRLYASDGRGRYSDHDATRLRIAAWTVFDALRRQRAEAELREQQVWLLMAMESADIGTWDWDLATDQVRFVSPFVLGADELRVRRSTGADWLKHTHPDDARFARPEVERAISGETDSFAIVVRMVRVLKPNQSWSQIYSRGRVVERDDSGRALRIMGTYEDVTEARRKAEAETEREAAMARAAKMASLGALASSLAHELNQPLAALTSFLQGSVRLLNKEPVERPEVTEALERSVELAHAASDIVRRFRHVLRREAPVKEAIDAVELLHSVSRRVGREALAAGVELVVDEGIEPVGVLGDSLQIEQVLINLVRNAVEALAGTDLERRIVVLSSASADGSVTFRVADTGPGIDLERREGLFDPLTPTREPGRGLGLVICQSIAELHGGRVYLERTDGDGTTFALELPGNGGGES